MPAFFLFLLEKDRDVDPSQSNPSAPLRYDAKTRATLQQAFREGWQLLKERQPAHSWEKHNDLKHALSERLMLLADQGVTDADGLLRGALEGLLGGDQGNRKSRTKDGLARAKRLKAPVSKTPKQPISARFRQRHLP
ncbi:MAG: hypothetical protein IAG10_21675 [Planctomycetaceae bacterium]|nr:hypothetical protein [Planctomycetaceae bacterium]